MVKVKTQKKQKKEVKDIYYLDRVSINIESYNILRKILNENPTIYKILKSSQNRKEATEKIKQLVLDYFKENELAYKYYKKELSGYEVMQKLSWQDFAAIRMMDYIKNNGEIFSSPNLEYTSPVKNQPFGVLWTAYKYGTGGAKPDFFEDMLHLFRQFNKTTTRELPSKEKVLEWMDKRPSGLDARMKQIRKKNRNRILKIFIKKIDTGEIKDNKYYFEEGLSQEEKIDKANKWWNERLFHLRFAIRKPELLNEMLGFSLSPRIMQKLHDAQEKGIPLFINPYYLSLLNIKRPNFAPGSDHAIRDYVIVSNELINTFGNIEAWEKEDIIEPGKPNAAGWILPSGTNVHRRYPEVSILIPDTVGRACGGLCVSCQRMYDFQSGNLNFNLDKLKPNETWDEKLERLLKYFEYDTQLRDILITGGDALMSSDKSLQKILDAVYEMSVRKIEANKKRKDGEKYAEMLRIRLGTRLPAYLPQRITTDLIKLLANFKEKASKIGIKQFIIQTHFESAMEITPEAKLGIERLISAGWIVTNQLVFTAAASKRGHTAKLRKVLNEVGVVPYYSFSVKGYLENKYNYSTNARTVQEQIEEKVLGEIPKEYYKSVKDLSNDPENMVENLEKLKKKLNLPFLSTDRNVMNLPGVGKSLTFRVIGITRFGKRILEFDYDHTRKHSPIIEKMDRIIIIESKTMKEYIKQIEEMGEDISEYESVYGYSLGETKERMPIFDYPDYDFKITDKLTNLVM